MYWKRGGWKKASQCVFSFPSVPDRKFLWNKMLTFFLLLSGFWPISRALWLLCFNISEKGICFRTQMCFWWMPFPLFLCLFMFERKYAVLLPWTQQLRNSSFFTHTFRFCGIVFGFPVLLLTSSYLLSPFCIDTYLMKCLPEKFQWDSFCQSSFSETWHESDSYLKSPLFLSDFQKGA